MSGFHRKILEECFHIETGSGFYVDREALTRVDQMLQLTLGSTIEGGKKCLKIWLENLKRVCRVWHEQTIIDDHLHFRAAELQAIFLFQNLSGSQCCTSCLRKLLQGCAIQLSFAVIKQTESPRPMIETVIGLVTDQHDSGSMMNMQIIGNIDEKSLPSMPLNPGIEYGAILRKVHRLRVFQIELDINMLQVHGWLL